MDSCSARSFCLYDSLYKLKIMIDTLKDEESTSVSFRSVSRSGEELLKDMEAAWRFFERVADDLEEEVITDPLVNKCLLDFQNAVCAAEKELLSMKLRVKDGWWRLRHRRMKEDKAIEDLTVKFSGFKHVADEYFGRESLLSALICVLFDRVASSREVVDFFKYSWKFRSGRLNKLKNAMKSVKKVLDDAEEKQFSDLAVKEWLDKVKHEVYQAEDLLDEIIYECLQPQLKTSRSSQFQVLHILSSHEKVKEDMKEIVDEIVERFEYLARQKDFLGLMVGIGVKRAIARATASHVDLYNQYRVYKRKNDVESIMNIVLSSYANGENLGVIAVNGVDRTCIVSPARLVFIDTRVRECFDFREWISISHGLDVYKAMKRILKRLGSKNCDAKTINQIQVELEERLKGKRFLIVLDDVRHGKYFDTEILVRLLKSGARGSKIIVTTSEKYIASKVMRSVVSHRLKELEVDNCWLSFAKHAFNDGNYSLRPKGHYFVQKTFQDHGFSQLDAEKWERLLKSCQWDLHEVLQDLGRASQNNQQDLQNETLEVLRLRYLFLPSHLKGCFAYCAIFPKGYEFRKEEVVLLWMAEGLVHPYGDEEMEAVADEYFHDLVSMSFFQQSSSYRSRFVLNNLVSDFAKFLSGDFCSWLDDDVPCKTSISTRHLSYARTEHDAYKKFMGIYGANHLRAFLPLGSSRYWQCKCIDEQVTHGLFSKLRRLRVLSLSQYHNVVELPDSIGNLKHLRYLNLSATPIKCLPEIVSTLHHLQTLILHDCTDLAVLPDSICYLKHLRYLNLHRTSIKRLPESMSDLHNLRTLILCMCNDLIELPANMGGLINLCRLDIRGTKLQKMPPQMGKLTKLRKLTHFIVGKFGGSSIKELGKLELLQGGLCISNLQNIVDVKDVFAANLKDKVHLKELELRWDGVTDCSLGVLEHLQPHRNLESLSIVGYGGKRFPNWVGGACFWKLVSLKLSGCKHCIALPPLGQLAFLKELSITACDRVVVVGSDFYGDCRSVPFNFLKSLSFAMMPQWREWVPNPSAFPFLQELYLRECPNLMKAFPRHLTSLTTLKIEGCEQLVASLPRSSKLQNLVVDRLRFIDFLPEKMEQISCFSSTIEKLVVMNCDLLKCFPLEFLPKLKTSFVYGCPNLESLSAVNRPLRNFEYLSSFEIGKCSNFISFPIEGLAAPNLTVLRLRDCLNLKSLPESMHSLLPSLMNLEIVDCPEIESFPEGGLPSNLKSLKIESCDKLIAARMQWNLQILPCLLHFQIIMFEGIESFPEKTLLPSTLTSLKIWDLQNLTYLDYEGLQHLTSLKELEISNCPKIESMPADRLPASLSCLSIWQCPLLEQRCEREKGEDWPKISHIPCVEIIH